MILAPHTIIGVAFARSFPANPFLAFLAGLFSHYVADMVPHWEYEISKSIHPNTSAKISLNKEFIFDVFKIGVDIFFGFLISFWIFYNGDPYYIIAGGLGGIFPDFLQFLYGKIKKEPLIILKKLHDSIHSRHLEKNFHNFLIGIFLQVVFVCIFVAFSLVLFPL